jgi:hypothetical protein
MTSLRTYYDPLHDRWLIDSWLALLPAQIEQARLHVLKTQRQRVAGMPLGDKRDTVAKSIAALEAGRIFHRPIPKTLEREATVFASTPGTGKIIVGA